MENKINIAEILKDCPKGMKLYSPIWCEVDFDKIDIENERHPIAVKSSKGTMHLAEDGRFCAAYETAECMLFPSSVIRDWSKFFKRGDVVIKNGGGMSAVFDDWANDTYTEFNTTINLYCDNNTGEEEVCSTILFRKANEEERKQFIKKVETLLKGKYNPKTLQVEPVKPECPFKPFDKVLVRNYDDMVWHANFFTHYKDNNGYHYVCIDNSYIYCIPYEGNEHLLGTTDPYTEGGSE